MRRGDWRLLLALLAFLVLGLLVIDAHRHQCPDPVCPWVQMFPIPPTTGVG
jgi:hypothetical protein